MSIPEWAKSVANNFFSRLFGWWKSNDLKIEDFLNTVEVPPFTTREEANVILRFFLDNKGKVHRESVQRLISFVGVENLPFEFLHVLVNSPRFVGKMNKKEAENMLDHEMYLLRINNDCQLWISYTLNNTYVQHQQIRRQENQHYLVFIRERIVAYSLEEFIACLDSLFTRSYDRAFMDERQRDYHLGPIKSYIPDRHSAPRQAVEEKNIESSRDTRHNEPTNVSATADSFNANFPDNIDNWEIPPWLPTITFRLRRLLKQNNDIHGRFVEILEDLSRTEHIHTKHLNLPKSDHHRHFENWHTKKFRCNAAYEYEKLSRFILDCAKLGYWKSIDPNYDGPINTPMRFSEDHNTLNSPSPQTPIVDHNESRDSIHTPSRSFSGHSIGSRSGSQSSLHSPLQNPPSTTTFAIREDLPQQEFIHESTPRDQIRSHSPQGATENDTHFPPQLPHSTTTFDIQFPIDGEKYFIGEYIGMYLGPTVYSREQIEEHLMESPQRSFFIRTKELNKLYVLSAKNHIGVFVHCLIHFRDGFKIEFLEGDLSPSFRSIQELLESVGPFWIE